MHLILEWKEAYLMTLSMALTQFAKGKLAYCHENN